MLKKILGVGEGRLLRCIDWITNFMSEMHV
jgi:hypothetical protein